MNVKRVKIYKKNAKIFVQVSISFQPEMVTETRVTDHLKVNENEAAKYTSYQNQQFLFERNTRVGAFSHVECRVTISPHKFCCCVFRNK